MQGDSAVRARMDIGSTPDNINPQREPDSFGNGTPLRVIIIMPLAEQRGGSELCMLHLIQVGQGQGVDWTVVFLQEGPMVDQIRKYGVDAIVIRSGKMRNLPRLFWTAKKIAELARRTNADLLLGWMGTGQLYGGIASLFSKVPAAWFQHGIPIIPILLDRIATRLPGRLIMACSQFGAEAQAKIAPHRPIRVVHPGVELQRFNPDSLPSPAEARQELGLPAKGLIIGIVGRLQRWKGMHVLIEAMPAVLEQYPDAYAVIVGGVHTFEPDYEPFLECMVQEKGLSKHVLFAGLQNNVPHWMQAMDIIVHASDNEPFGMVIIEAMALGKPVIATNSGGPKEIITEGRDGLLVPYGDSAALAQAIVDLLDDPNAVVRQGEAAQKRAQEFSIELYASKVIASCKEAVAKS